MFCHGVEGEEEKAENDSDVDPDYKDDYDHGDDWDPEELLVDSDDKEEESNDKEEDIDRCTTSERACFHHIDNLEAASNVNNNDNTNDNNDDEGEEKKDERYNLEKTEL